MLPEDRFTLWGLLLTALLFIVTWFWIRDLSQQVTDLGKMVTAAQGDRRR